MLQANRAQLLTQLHLDSLEIRRKELNYWSSSFSKLGALGALLCGFASNVMIMGVQEPINLQSLSIPASSLIDVETLPHLIFILSTVSAFGCNLLLLTACTICCLFAPTQSLRGRGQRSFTRSIKSYEKAFPVVLSLFEYGLISYSVSACMAVLHFYRVVEALMLLPILAAFLVLLKRHIARLQLSFVATEMKSGRMKSIVIHDIGNFVTRDTAFGQPRDPTLQNVDFNSAFADMS